MRRFYAQDTVFYFEETGVPEADCQRTSLLVISRRFTLTEILAPKFKMVRL